MGSSFEAGRAILALMAQNPKLAALPEWELAVRMKISPSYWNHLKAGRRRGDLEVAQKLARGFKVDLMTVLQLGGLKEKRPRVIAGGRLAITERGLPDSIRVAGGSVETVESIQQLQCELERLSRPISGGQSLDRIAEHLEWNLRPISLVLFHDSTSPRDRYDAVEACAGGSDERQVRPEGPPSAIRWRRQAPVDSEKPRHAAQGVAA